MDNSPMESITEVSMNDEAIISAALFGDEPEEYVAEATDDSDESPTIVENDESTDEESVNPEPPVIEPPKSWSAEEKEAFRNLPLEVQKSLSERDAKRNADISRQFNEVNEQKKAVEAERQSVIAERAKYVQALEHQTNFIQYELGKKYGQIDFVRLAAERPDEAVRIQAEYARDKAQLENSYNHLVAAKSQQEAELSVARKEHLSEQSALLAEAIPEWKDPVKREAIKSDVGNYLMKTCGFTPQDLNSLVDHREFTIAHKAFLYDKGLAEAKARKVSNPPRVQSPTVNQSQGVRDNSGLTRQAKNTLRTTNNTRAQASIIAGLLD